MMRRESFPIASIYVPVKRRTELNPKTVDELAANILQAGQQTPILVRRDGEHFILVAFSRSRPPAPRQAPEFGEQSAEIRREFGLPDA